MNSEIKLWWVLLWPPVDKKEWRRNLIISGCVYAGFYSFLWGAIILISPFVYLFESHDIKTIYTLINAIPHFVLGIVVARGIYINNILASVSAALLTTTTTIYNIFESGKFEKNEFIFLVGTIFFIHSTRAIFKENKLKYEE